MDPPVKALIVYNSNPAASAPDQTRVIEGLRRPDLFKVVLEQFQTDTADYADFVLPVTTFLEHTDLYYAYGHYYMQFARPALPRPGEVKSNVEIFRLLAERMGFEDECFRQSEEDMIREALNSGSPFLEGVTLERLEREHFVRLKIGDPFLPFAGGKINLDASGLDYEPPAESRAGDPELRARFPLELISSKNDDSMNGTFGYRPRLREQTSRLWIHPQDAAERSIRTGDRVRIFNQRGACEFAAWVTADVRPGVVRVPSMGWNKHRPGGAGVNVLTSPRLTDAGGGPTFYNCLVQVEKCSDSPVD
jgi:anaerobic selenocysteine-containing dehydrogenase